jgi:hypothetical protein
MQYRAPRGAAGRRRRAPEPGALQWKMTSNSWVSGSLSSFLISFSNCLAPSAPGATATL